MDIHASTEKKPHKPIDKEATFALIEAWWKLQINRPIDNSRFIKEINGSNWEQNLKDMAEFCQIDIIYKN